VRAGRRRQDRRDDPKQEQCSYAESQNRKSSAPTVLANRYVHRFAPPKQGASTAARLGLASLRPNKAPQRRRGSASLRSASQPLSLPRPRASPDSRVRRRSFFCRGPIGRQVVRGTDGSRRRPNRRHPRV
jgi:hypothetical protein